MFALRNQITYSLIKKCSTSPTTVIDKNGVRKIILSQPKIRNALGTDTLKALIANIKKDEVNKDLRVIVIEAAGPIFSSGHNFKEMTEAAGIEKHKEIFSLATQLMNTIISSPVPIIAKVDGLAAAGGCQLVAQCDIAVCTPNSTFSTPGSNFGLFCSTPGVAIARSVPRKTSLYMLFTGDSITAEEALRTGLVTKVCPKETLDAEVDKICTSIVAKSRTVVELGKKFYYKQIQEQDVMKAFAMAADVMVEHVNLPNGKEGIKSFAEKRKPKWI